jgi:hypothetical protein
MKALIQSNMFFHYLKKMAIKLTYKISDELLNPTKNYSLLEFASHIVDKSVILGPQL